MRTLPSSIGHHHRFTHLVIWTLAVTFSTNVMLGGVLSAQSPPAQTTAPAVRPPAVDLSAKALRGLALSDAPRSSHWVHERVAVPQSVGRIDTKAGKGKMFGFLLGSLLVGVSGLLPLADSTDEGNSCDFPDSPSCSTLRTVGLTLVSASAVMLGMAFFSRPGPNGARAVTGATSNNGAATVITNSTGHALEVMMEGPVEKRVVISSGSKQTIELEAGQYRQTVRAMGVDAEPYLTMQVYERGTAYKERYYFRK